MCHLEFKRKKADLRRQAADPRLKMPIGVVIVQLGPRRIPRRAFYPCPISFPTTSCSCTGPDIPEKTRGMVRKMIENDGVNGDRKQFLV